MRFKDSGNAITIWLSARDTVEWATRPGAAWPCSTLRGKRLCADFDMSGLIDLTINGKDGADCDCHEFNAITSDFIETRITPDHLVWFVTVGQFRAGGSDPA